VLCLERYDIRGSLADTDRAVAAARQDLAVTGSVNQHGAAQAIGGVNEKIEGFFDTCQARRRTWTQGVANVQHLMLRNDVIEACTGGRFAIYPITRSISGSNSSAGRALANVALTASIDPTVNRRVEDGLRAFASIQKAFSKPERARSVRL
jgi:hypothetical protein